MGTDRAGGATSAEESIVVSEQIDDQYEPTPAEVLEYGDWLGMDREGHGHLMWIAREALKAPLPEHWKLCQSPTEDLFYFHFKSGQSSWDHPSDASFQALFQRYKDTPAPTVACEAEDAASQLELRQLLRRAQTVDMISDESFVNVLSNCVAGTIAATEYIRWWQPRIEGAEKAAVSDKLAAHLDQLCSNLDGERARVGHLFEMNTPAIAALELALARLTPEERELIKGCHHGVVERWTAKNGDIAQNTQQAPTLASSTMAVGIATAPTARDCHEASRPLRHEAAVTASAVSSAAGFSALLKPVQTAWDSLGLDASASLGGLSQIFRWRQPQRTLLPV
jgi:centrosomal protein CEP164